MAKKRKSLEDLFQEEELKSKRINLEELYQTEVVKKKDESGGDPLKSLEPTSESPSLQLGSDLSVDQEELFPESDIQQSQKRKEFEIEQDLARPSKEEVREENIKFQDKLIEKGRESIEGLEGIDLLTSNEESFIKSSGVDEEGLASVGDLSDRKKELKQYLNRVKQEGISKAAEEKFSLAAKMKAQEDSIVQFTPEEMYQNAKDQQFNFSVEHFDEDEQVIARDIKELNNLYSYMRTPESANMSLEDKNKYSIRMTELKDKIDQFHEDRGTKKLYDPETGNYIDEAEAKEQNKTAALEYKSKYDQAAKELEGNSLDKLEQIHSKESSKLEYLEDIYNQKREWIPGEEPMTAHEFKDLYDRQNEAMVNVGKTGFSRVDIEEARKLESAADKIKEIDKQLVNQRARFDAVNEAYLLNTDMATREFGFIERLGSGIVEGTAAVFGNDYTLQGTDFETVQNYIKVMDEEGGDVTEAQRDNAAIETMDKVGYAIGSSVPVMAEMAAVSYLTGGAAAELGLVRYGNMMRKMMYHKYGRNGHLAYNFMKENLRQAVTFKLSGQGASQGMGEATAQQVLDMFNPAKKFTGKFAPLKEFFTRASVGTVGETTGELLGEYVNQLTENGFDTDRAFQDAFGRTPEDIYDNIMVTAITSAMFSGTSNAKVLLGAKKQIDAMPDDDPRKKEYQARVEEAIQSQEEVIDAGKDEEVKVQETLATEGEPELVEQDKIIANLPEEKRQEEYDKLESVKEPKKLDFLPDELELVHLSKADKDLDINFDIDKISEEEGYGDSFVRGMYLSDSPLWASEFPNYRGAHKVRIKNDGLLFFKDAQEMEQYLSEKYLDKNEGYNEQKIREGLKKDGIKGILNQDFSEGSGSELIVLDNSIVLESKKVDKKFGAAKENKDLYEGLTELPYIKEAKEAVERELEVPYFRETEDSESRSGQTREEWLEANQKSLIGKLTPEQVKKFKDEVRDIEAVTEEEGEVELFHGTNKDFDTFEMSEEGVVWLTDNSEYAKQQGSKTKSVKISPQNTLTREKLEATSDEDLYKAVSSVEEVSKEDFYEGYLPEIKLRLEEGLPSEKVFEGMGEGKVLKALGYDVEKVKNPYDKTGEESYFYKVYDENLVNKPKVEEDTVVEGEAEEEVADQEIDVDLKDPKKVEAEVSKMESKLEEDTKKYEESLRSDLKVEETKEEVKEEVVEDSPAVKRVKEELDYAEMKVEDTQEEIKSTKQDLKEELDKLRKKKDEIRSRKIPRDEKADLLEDVDYEIEDVKIEYEASVETLKDEVADWKQEVRYIKRELAKAQEQSIEDDIEVYESIDDEGYELIHIFHKGDKVAVVNTLESRDGFMLYDKNDYTVKSYKTKAGAIKAAKKLALEEAKKTPTVKEVKADQDAKLDQDTEAEIQAKVEEFRNKGKENIQSFISKAEESGYKPMGEDKPKKKGKTKIQKQIDADVEGKSKDKVTVKETVVLKNRLKEFGKGYRKAKKDFKSFGSDIKQYFKDQNIRGNFTPKQTEMISRAANNVVDSKSYEEFEAYADKVIDKVNFAEDVSATNNSKKTTKSLIKKKSIPSNVKALGERLLAIDPKKLEDPLKLNALLSEYNEGTAGFGSVDQVIESIQALEDEVTGFDNNVIENYLKKAWKESDFDMTFKDFKEYMELEKASSDINEAIKLEDLGNKPSKTRSRLERVLKWRLPELKDYANNKPDIDSKSKRSINTFLKIYEEMDIENFSVAQLRELNNIINEITIFDSFNRTGDLESLIQGNVEGKKLLKKYKGKTQFSALASSKLSKGVLSLDNFFKSITSGEYGKQMVADLTKEVSKGNAIATKKSDVFNVAIDQLFKKLDNQQESGVRLDMHSFLSQHESDLSDVDIEEDLKAKKAQIELQIDKLEQESKNKNRAASTRRGFKKMAEEYKKVYEESFKDIESKEDLDNKLSKEEKAILDFSRNNFENTKEDLKDNYDRFTGKEFIDIDNYLPLSAKPFAKYGETDLSGFKYDPPSNNTVDKKQSGTTKKRVKLQTKNPDGTVKSNQELEQMDAKTLYLFNFKDNMKQKYRETLYDIHTLKARKDLDHTINSSYVKELFDAELHKEVVRKISGQVNTQRGSYYDQIKDYSKWIKYPLNALRYVKATKLKTVDQWVKQPISIIAHTSAVYGKSANKAYALSMKIATDPEYKAAFDKLISTSDVSNRTTEGEYIIKEQESLVVEALKKFGLEEKGLSKAYIKAVDGALVSADDMATKVSWLAAYIHETGGSKDFDLLEASENVDQDAIARADSGSADINNVSDFSKSPDMWRDSDKTLVRELLFNYKSFSVNMAVRNAIAWRDLLSKPKSELTDDDRKMAAKYITGSIAASIIFQATKATIVHVFWDELTDLILGVNTDDEDDVMERLKKATAKGVFDYAFGGLPGPAEEGMKHFINWGVKEGKRIVTGEKPKKYDDFFYTSKNYLPGAYGMPVEIINNLYEGATADEITPTEQYKILSAFASILGEGNMDRFFTKAVSKARKEAKKDKKKDSEDAGMPTAKKGRGKKDENKGMPTAKKSGSKKGPLKL